MTAGTYYVCPLSGGRSSIDLILAYRSSYYLIFVYSTLNSEKQKHKRFFTHILLDSSRNSNKFIFLQLNFTMTSILIQAQKDPVIPFEPKVKHETMKEVTLFLERFEPGEGRGATGRWTKVREQALFCSETDKESILRTIIEFEDVSRESRLDLSTAKLKFKYFRQCLGGEVRTSWDNAKDNKPETLNNWHIANQEFIAYFSSLLILPLRNGTRKLSRRRTLLQSRLLAIVS